MKRIFVFIVFLLAPFISLSQVVTQIESVESNIFPMPGWKIRKGIVADFSRIDPATTTTPTATNLTTGYTASGTGFAAATSVVAGGGANAIMLNSFVSVSADTAVIISKPFDFSNNGGVDPTFSFWVYRNNQFPTINDRLQVFWSGVSPGTGATLTPINHQAGNNVINRSTGLAPAVVATSGWFEYRFTLPAATYNTKRNYFVIRGITQGGDNIYLDKFTVNTYPTAMLATDVKFDIVQQNAATTSAGATNQWIVGLRCVVGGNSGCGALVTAGINNPVKLDSLLFNTNGSSNSATDILNARIFYTGGYEQFNSTYASPFPATSGITGAAYPKSTYGATLTGVGTNLDFQNTTGNCFYLEYDTTYFWLVYDLKPAAVVGDFLDGDFRGAVVGGPTTCPSPGGSATCITATTTTFTLAGACQVSDVAYCVPTYSTGVSRANYTNNDYLAGVSLIGYGGTNIGNGVNLATSSVPNSPTTQTGLPAGLACQPFCAFTAHPPDYEFRNPALPGNSVTLQQGTTYSITVKVGTWFSNNAVAAWIDFNRDGDFANGLLAWAGVPGSSSYTGERLGFASLLANGTATWTFTVPATGSIPAPFQGSTRLRVREVFAASSAAMNPCSSEAYGECEDFIVTIIPNCSASYKLWLGNTNDWNNPANWCPSVPTITDSTVVNRTIVNPGTRPYFYPVIKSGILANCKSLTISSQDTLFIDAPNPSLTSLKVAGNLNNNGYINVVGTKNLTNNAVFPNSTGSLLNFSMTPLCGKNYKAGQSQIIYLASDLALLGMQGGDRITAIQLNAKNNDVTVPIRFYNNFAIGFANTAVSSFTSTVPITGITTVYTNASQPIVFGENTFTLATPIVWNGTSNIVIQYTYTNPASTGSLNNDYIDITQSTGRNSTLILGRILTSVATAPIAGAFTGQVVGDITANGSPIANASNAASALMTLRPNATFVWDRPYGKAKVVVQGNFTNNGPFSAGKSLFVMDSTLTQFIRGTRAVPFYTFSMAKSAANRAIFLSNDSVSIQDTFFLATGQMVMNGKPLSMTWSNPAAFSRFIQGNGGTTAGTGLLISENPNSIVNWTIGNYAAPATTRTIPFGNRMDTTSAVASITYIPLTFTHKQGDMGIFKVGTKNWSANTLPGPPAVGHTNIFNSTNSNEANTVDRYWMIGKTGPQNPAANFPVADITMRFSTNSTAPQVSERPTIMSALKPGVAQPWRIVDSTWLRISAVATTNVSTINSAVGNGTTITYTTSAAHTFVTGQAVTISGAITPAGYNVANVVITGILSTTTFTIAGTQIGVSSGTSTATGSAACGNGTSTPFNQQQTALSYVQSYAQVAANTSDSVRVTSWDWPTVPTLTCPRSTPSSPIGNFTPWTISVNTTPLGTSYVTPIINTDSISKVYCNNDSSGVILVSISGGVQPFSYLWNDGVTTEDRSNLSVGTYTLTVTGSNGVSILKVFNIELDTNFASIEDPFSSTPFQNCNSDTFELSVINTSNAINTNTNYYIDWGDGSNPYNANTLSNSISNPIKHSYTSKGHFTITHIVTGPNGCTDTAKYLVYNGTNPSIAYSNNSSSFLQCLPATDTIVFANTSNNSPGTLYTLSFNDGTPDTVLNHPLPPYFVHTFNTSSCGATGGQIPNSFYIRVKAENPCGVSFAQTGPYTTVTPPKADFTISDDTIYCNTILTILTNTSISGEVVDANGVCNNSIYSGWKINPSSGWTLTNSNLGTVPPTNAFGGGSDTLKLRFDSAGVYQITLYTRDTTLAPTSCRNDNITKTIVYSPITNVNAGADFRICKNSPAVQLVGFTPAGGVWSGPNVTPQGLFSPSVLGVKNLIYTYTQGACVFRDTLKATVDSLPTNSLTGSTTCSGVPTTINVNGSGSFLWSNNSTSQIISVAPTTSTYYSVTITNVYGCTKKDSAYVLVNPLPTVNAGTDVSLCNQPIPYTLTPITASGNWTGNNITGAGVYTPSSNGTFDVYYTFTNNQGCSNTDTVSITVGPPSAITAGSDTSVCTNSGNLILQNFSPSNGIWIGQNVSNNGIFNTDTVGTFDLIYSFGNSTCLVRDTIEVIVNPLPSATTTNNTICERDSITFGVTGIGSYLWSNGATTQNITVSPLITTNYAVTVTNQFGCTAKDTAAVTVKPLPIINNALSQSICNSGNTNIVNWTSNLSGVSYNWSVVDFGLISGALTSGTGALNSMQLINNSNLIDSLFIQCYGVAQGCIGDTVVYSITVNPIPNVNPLSSYAICSRQNTTAIINTSTTPNANFTWNCVGGQGLTGYTIIGTNNIPSQTIINSNPNYLPQSLIYSITAFINGCQGLNSSYSVSVLPRLDTTLYISALNSYFYSGNQFTQSGVYVDSLTNQYGCDSIVTINLNIVTGLSQEELIKVIKVFPVPSTGVFNIDCEVCDYNNLEYVISDISGRVIRDISNDKKIIDISNEPTGVYFLNMIIDEKNIRIKLVKL